MDIRIRSNEHCIVNLPSCGYVFSSTRSAFIAYGFQSSTLEMQILRNLLERRGIEAVEAAEQLAAAQYAFCTKICSKIITAQFCIVLANTDLRGGVAMPNANVYTEYGLMLGFNKYVIPFQRDDQTLPFNVAGLDTVKYSTTDFERKAATAIDSAIAKTQQRDPGASLIDQKIGAFWLSRNTVVSSEPGEKILSDLVRACGFHLLVDFTGMKYICAGIYTALRAEAIVWRIEKLLGVVRGRLSTLKDKVRRGMFPEDQAALAAEILNDLNIWIFVTSQSDKDRVTGLLKGRPESAFVHLFTIEEVERELEHVLF